MQEMKQDAVVYQLSIIGEAANRLTSDFRNKYPDFPIKEAVSMRNFLIHGYDEVDLKIVWKTLKEDLPLLKNIVLNILKKS